MTTFQNQAFRDETVEVDGNIYEGCTFTNSSLVYMGGDLPSFNRCEFEGVNIQLQGGAYMTLKYLTGLYHGGFSDLVENALVDIERQSTPMPDRRENSQETGTNYAQLAFLNVLLIVITIGIVAALIFGFLTYPEEQVLEENEPLREEISFDLMPVLPDELAVSYDDLRDGQLTQLNSFTWVDEGNGIVSIPVEEAKTLILENGPPAWASEEGD